MIFAKKKNQSELVCATDFERDSAYFCPSCGARVTFKNGQQKQAHFAHLKKTCNFYSEGETDAHVTGKKLIKLWAEKRHKKTKIEAYLPELKQRADVLINLKNSQLVIEYQCSPLSLNSFRQRTDGYKNHGYRIFWILGERHKLGHKLTQQQAMFINFHKNIGYFLVFLDVKRQCLILNYELCFENLHGIQYSTKGFGDATALIAFVKENHRNKRLILSKSELVGQLTKFEKNYHHFNRYLKKQIDFCYVRRELLLGFPLCCLSAVRLPPIYRHEDIFWRIRVVLELRQVASKVISKDDLALLFSTQQTAADTFYDLPLINHLAIKQVDDIYRQRLIESKILIPIDGTENYKIHDQMEWSNDAILKKEKLSF